MGIVRGLKDRVERFHLSIDNVLWIISSDSDSYSLNSFISCPPDKNACDQDVIFCY